MAKQTHLYRFRKAKTSGIEPKGKTQIDYTKYFSFVAPLLIFFGVTRLFLFYRHFNVNIITFLDFSEILTSFFDLIVSTSFFGSAMLLFILFMYVIDLIKLKRSFWIIYTSLALLPFFIALWKENGIEHSYTYATAFLIIPMTFIFIILRIVGANTQISSFVIRAIYITSAIYFGMLALSFLASTNARRIKRHNQYFGVRVLYKDSTIFVSDSTKYYIGNTANFIFIYDEIIKVTRVDKLEDIKSIEFPPSPPRFQSNYKNL